jgi:hypothetical protein
MKFKLLIAALAVSFSMQSFAGLLIDPYFGIGQSKPVFVVAGVPAAESSDASSSTSFGSRLGYSFLLISAGLDYEMSTVASDDELTITNTSLFVGVDLPILFRFWAEYFISSSLDQTDSTIDFDFKDGYGLGIGFTGLPFVSLNLEVQTVNYDFTVLGYDGTVTNASTVFSVSLPLDF